MPVDTKRFSLIRTQLDEILGSISKVHVFGAVVNAMLVWGGALGAFFKVDMDHKSNEVFQSALNLMNSTGIQPPIQEGLMSLVYNKILGVFNMEMRYEIKLQITEETKRALLDNDAFVDQHYDDYVNDLFNNWTMDTMFTKKGAESWHDVKLAGLQELFRFEYWVTVPYDAFETIINELKTKYKRRDEFERQLRKYERELIDFESQLAASELLLRTPYKQWVNSMEFRAILNRQPERIRKAIDHRARLFGI